MTVFYFYITVIKKQNKYYHKHNKTIKLLYLICNCSDIENVKAFFTMNKTTGFMKLIVW